MHKNHVVIPMNQVELSCFFFLIDMLCLVFKRDAKSSEGGTDGSTGGLLGADGISVSKSWAWEN